MFNIPFQVFIVRVMHTHAFLYWITGTVQHLLEKPHAGEHVFCAHRYACNNTQSITLITMR